MSHPPGPGSSPYGQNPYGQPPQQPYGPQPAAQPYGQPGHAYGYPPAPQAPQAPQPGPYGPYGQYPGGPGGPGGSGTMPGKANAARIMMYIAGGLQGLLMLAALIGLLVASRQIEEMQDDVDIRVGLGVGYAVVLFFLVVGALGVFLAAQFSSGGNGVRVWSVVWASLIILSGLVAVTTVGVLWIALGVVTIVMLCQAQTRAWFDRPRH